MNDPIADLLTRIRNAGLRKHKEVKVPYSKIKAAIAELFYKEGFVQSVEKTEKTEKTEKSLLTIGLKYDKKNCAIIRKIQRISRPGLRNYKTAADILPFMCGQGVLVVSTSQGLLSDAECRKRNIGGEIICSVY